MKLISTVTSLSTDILESDAKSNLMEGFPPICKKEPLEVQLYYIKEYFALTGENLRLEDILDMMYGGSCLWAKEERPRGKQCPKKNIWRLNNLQRRPRRRRLLISCKLVVLVYHQLKKKFRTWTVMWF
jgi:hypothetical protein